MVGGKQKTWMVIQAKASDYSDIEGVAYEYPPRIPHGRQINVGDIIVVCLPSRDALSGGRIVGIGHIKAIGEGLQGRKVAHYDRYLKIDPPLSFEAIGGDPRQNQTNSINPLPYRAVETILESQGISEVGQLPIVAEVKEDREPPESHLIRTELLEAVTGDLLGPAGGAEEEIVDMSVRDRYLVGKLAPPDLRFDPSESDDLSGESDVGSEDGSSERSEPANESLIPSSFGLTFCVDATAKTLSVDASWGHYQRVESEVHFKDDGSPERAWKRRRGGGVKEIALTIGPVKELVPDTEQPDVHIEGFVRPPTEGGQRLVTLFLVNKQEAPARSKDEAWLFQPELVVRDPEGRPIFRRRPTGERGSADAERAALAMLYRERVEFAVGHGVSVHWEVSDERVEWANEVRTSVIPLYDVPDTEPPSNEDIPAFAKLERDMKRLSELQRDDLIETLSVLADEYEGWIGAQHDRVRAGQLSGYEDEANNALGRCELVLERLKQGIRTLETDDDALDAFQFANRAMWQQRVRSIYSLQRRRGDKPDWDDIDVPVNRSWRPFQLAFFLLSIPSLSDPRHADRTDTVTGIADLLWFPTGGGKTEAYLGVAAFAMAIRRLQGDVSGLDAGRGLAVIMRYTLRLLTLQQFQRASTLLCAMEVIRRKSVAAGDKRWGNTPFRLGLWVGQRATPNSTADAQQAIQNAAGNNWQRSGVGTPHQLTSCPWCGQEIKEDRDIKVRPFARDIGRTLIFCSDRYGRCEFSPKQAPNEGLPVVVVDEEIYRLLPAMIIATVDKFAQMPWKGQVQALFGRVTGECPRHGFLTPEAECTGTHNRSGSLTGTRFQETSQFRPPDLIIQDELHLISGPLGTMVGLYETAIDELSTWEYDEKPIRPKVIASTATVRKASEQVHGVFLRAVSIFPPHGLDASDNFFARQRPVSPAHPGRRYIGVCAPGASRPSVLIRVYVAFLTAAQALRQKYGAAADPWMTLLGYFNSLRELGGMRRLVEDDVRTRSYRVDKEEHDERSGLVQRDVSAVDELTSRASSADIPRILDRMELEFPAIGDPMEKRPLDVVLATNMVSVGVDVQRLGLMVVNGQPKTTAEYIQATSRVGRHHPGLVCTVLNWARPRDSSHYETFEHYHATFYQHVEAQSVTPYAPRAMDRGLMGVLTSIARLDDEELNPNAGAGKLLSASYPEAVHATDAISQRSWNVTHNTHTRDLAKDMVKQRIDRWASEAQKSQRKLGYKTRRDSETVGLLRVPGVEQWDLVTTPTSMREVEPGISLILDRSASGDQPSWKAASTETNKEKN